jgi:hypothetical protein
MSRVTVDYSRFPLVIQNMRFGYTAQEMEQALLRYVPLWEGDRPFALAVWNEPGVALPDAPMRAKIAALQQQHAAGIRKTNLVTAIVMPQFSYRAALSALNWLSPPTSPQRACASIIEAVEHCCEVLTRESIPLNPAIHALRDELRRNMGYGEISTPDKRP